MAGLPPSPIAEVHNRQTRTIRGHVQLEVSRPDEHGSYTITLSFEENPILQSEAITRTITRGEEAACHCTCSPVRWKQVRPYARFVRTRSRHR